MVTRSKKAATGRKRQTKGRVKVSKLELNKETVKVLSSTEQGKVRGGLKGNSVQQICETDLCRSQACPGSLFIHCIV